MEKIRGPLVTWATGDKLTGNGVEMWQSGRESTPFPPAVPVDFALIDEGWARGRRHGEGLPAASTAQSPYLFVVSFLSASQSLAIKSPPFFSSLLYVGLLLHYNARQRDDPPPRSPPMSELFAPRIRERSSISADQALIHMIKVMMGTGMLSLPLAFKHSGLWLGLVLLAAICLICIFCTRQLVYAQHYIGYLKSQQRMDYANVMRSAVELGPPWIREYGYFWKQVVNVNMFVAQFGFCCVYFVFMADNLKQFFDQTSNIHISQAGWIALLLVPILGLCTIRELKALAPLAAAANAIYLVAVIIVLQQLFVIERPSWSLPAVGDWSTLPLFFGTVMFAFEGVAVVLPIENQMDEPIHFITPNGVLNTSCFLVLTLYCTVGFFGYLRFGDAILDTLTLNLPQTTFYQCIKIMFVGCILVSYPLQFYVPMERVEKFIKRKVVPARQEKLIYAARFFGVVFTCLMAELIPHLALFISLVGSVAGTSLTLVFPPMIELLCCYSKETLTPWIWARNIFLMMFACVGFFTGTYSSMAQIVEAFGKHDV